MNLKLTVLAALTVTFSLSDLSGQSATGYPKPASIRPDANFTFSNGVRLSRRGDRIIITEGGRRYVMSRSEAQPPPASMRRSCGTIKRYLDTHRVDSFWRHLSLWWADNCL